MTKFKVIISTGQGRLHLIQSALSLLKIGVDIRVITGWIPGKYFPDVLIDQMGKVLGRNNLASGLRKRTPEGLSTDRLHSCSFSEFTGQFLIKISRFRLISRARASVLSWKLFGFQSTQYLKDANIFHVRSGAGHGTAIKIAKKRGMKILVDHSIAHPLEMKCQILKAYKRDGLLIDRYNTTFPDDEFWQMVLEDCQMADLLLVNSFYVRDSFVDHGYPEEKIKVAQLGVDKSFNGLKTCYKSEKKIRLVFTGGFGNRKGATVIIDSIKLLIDQGISFHLDVIGTVMEDIKVPEWFRQCPDVALHGHKPQEELKRFLSQSDLYIFPTYVEGSAQSVKEAMSVGLPVITTKNSGSPIIHGLNGWLISDDDHNSLAEAILILKGDSVLCEKIGRNAAATIADHHTWSRYAETVNSIYSELVS